MEKTKVELPKKYRIGFIATFGDSKRNVKACYSLAKLVTNLVNNDEAVSEKDIGDSFLAAKQAIVSKPMIYSVAETKHDAMILLIDAIRAPIEPFLKEEE